MVEKDRKIAGRSKRQALLDNNKSDNNKTRKRPNNSKNEKKKEEDKKVQKQTYNISSQSKGNMKTESMDTAS